MTTSLINNTPEPTEKPKLSDFLTGKEWYDNSFTNLILACPRKALLHRSLNIGMGVGPGADFGTCVHGAVATYYYWWRRLEEPKRRLKAMRTFLSLHETIFKGPYAEGLDNKHTKENGMMILDHYFDTHLGEDELLQPVEIELAGAIEMTPRPSDPIQFVPFWWVFRIDGIHKRLRYGDYFIRETKTTSGGVKREMMKLKLSRQPLGYLWSARQFPNVDATGVIPDVIGVTAKTREVARDYFHKTAQQTEDWRLQTINIVERWRALEQTGIKNIEFTDADNGKKLIYADVDLNQFVQNTSECSAYGQCAFYDICDHGLTESVLSKYGPNIWNPLANAGADDPLESERHTIQDASSIKESIVL